MIKVDENLTAKIEPFDTFWEAPENMEAGYASFGRFYKRNYGKYLPTNKDAEVLVISCGTGYFVNVLSQAGYGHVVGIDSDDEKVQHAAQKGLNCLHRNAFEFLKSNSNQYDFIFCEQEINHLTKDEILVFMGLCREALKPGGVIIVHSLNGANPITGSEALAQNFDHYNTFTDYSIKQILEHGNFNNIKTFPLNLYIFYENPLNYLGIIFDTLFNLFFRLSFIFYGKHNKIFSKKFGAIASK